MRNKRMYVTTDTRFKRYMRRTWFNKLVSIGLLIAGIAYAYIVKALGESNITFSVLLWIMAIAMFFARTDWREL